MRLANKEPEPYLPDVDKAAGQRCKPKKWSKMQSKLNIGELSIDSGHLFEQLCTERQLLEGWYEVKKNRGSSGSDGQTIEGFETRLQEEIKQLKKELENWQYKPQPVRRVEIPKPEGGVRLLGVPCIRDRVLQSAIKQLLEPILEPLFSPNSYGFRPGRNQGQAVEAAQKIVASGKNYVVDIDLSKFFDRVNQDKLVRTLSTIIKDKRIVRLVGNILRSGVMQDGIVTATTEGTVQGSPLSPLLSNLVLDALDKEIESRGLEHCRFADDCNIFVKTRKAGERVMKSISKFIEKKLKLVVNQEKSQVAESGLVKFLGITIVNGTRAIAKKAIGRAMQKVKELTPRGTHKTLEDTIKEINSWYVGWSNYYSMTQYPSQLKAIEAHIRRRLRARIVDQQKSRRNLFNNLRKKGISYAKAAQTSYNNKKRWAISHMPAMERAYPNDWFIKTMGLKIRSNEKRSDWFEIKKWIQLA
jgi:RNA-directed DNA polymerase